MLYPLRPLRSELGKNLNTDEAIALGAVYQAAALGQGFKVKKFNVKEANVFPIEVCVCVCVCMCVCVCVCVCIQL